VNTLFANTTGRANTASGFAALQSNTTGYSNLASGVEALRNNTNGYRNTATGFNALYSNTVGNTNTAIGWRAGIALTSGSNNIYIGSPGVASESNTLRLGSVQTRTFIRGVANVPLSGSLVVINSAGQLGVRANSSSAEEILPEVLQVVEAQQQQIEEI
jgi:hypothetical protein